MNSKEIAAKYGVSLRTAQRWIKEGSDKIQQLPRSDISKASSKASDWQEKVFQLIEQQNKILEIILKNINKD